MLSTLLKGNRTLLSLKDIRVNGYHVETHDENGKGFLCITSNDCGRKRILESIMCLSSGLYAATIELLNQTKSFGMTSWIQTHNGFGKTD
jgi:hypothetical protein